MNRSIQNEIRLRLPNFNQLALPQVFLEGQHLGVSVYYSFDFIDLIKKRSQFFKIKQCTVF